VTPLAGGTVLRVLKISAQALISLLCLGYALRGVDAGEFMAVLSGYPKPAFLVVLFLFVLCICVQALRLSLLFDPSLGLFDALKAVTVGLGLNNVLPAKGGEVFKVAYIGRSLGRAASVAAGAVFFERFFDANVLCLLSALALSDVVERSILWRAGFFLIICWSFFIFFRSRPDVFERLWGVIPLLRRVKFLDDLREHLLYGMTVRQLLLGSLTTAGVWAAYCAYTVYAFISVGETPLTPTNAAVVFLISAAGQLLPSSPGSLGVFEASIIWGFGIFGVGREQALGIAILTRALQLLPTVGAAAVIFTSRAKERDIG
jgi:uncharacterized protein (TIRG00374 family)